MTFNIVHMSPLIACSNSSIMQWINSSWKYGFIIYFKLIKGLVDFVEKAYKIKVMKLVAKFMLNQD